jgi:long-chain acyl-CoA synthetase
LFQKIIVLDVESKCQTKRAELSVEEIFQRTRHSDVALPIETEPNDLITFVMTSGSTGQPKVILKTNRNYLSLVESLDHKEFNQMTPNDTILVTGFCHISGQCRLFCVINGGSRLAINRIDKDPETMLQVINKYEISHAFLFPTQLNFLAKNYQKFDKIYMKSIRDMLTGGAPISESTYKFIAEEFNFENFKNCKFGTNIEQKIV